MCFRPYQLCIYFIILILTLSLTSCRDEDAIAWGKAPDLFVEAQALADMPKARSFERLPGGNAGNYTDTNNNQADFVIASPAPQNSQSPPTPYLPNRLKVRLEAPSTVTPGASFTYTFVIENRTGQDLNDLRLYLPLTTDLTLNSISDFPPAIPGDESPQRTSDHDPVVVRFDNQ